MDETGGGSVRPMDRRTPPILATALALGAAGDILLRGGEPGLGFTVWAWVALAAFLVLSRRLGVRFRADALPFAVLAFICSALVTVRASPTLAVLNIGATAAAATLVSLRTRAPALRRAPFLDYLRAAGETALYAALGGIGPVRDAFSRVSGAVPSSRARRLSVLRGTVLTAPAFLFFGILLSAADASFERLVLDIVRFDAWTPVEHGAVVAALTLGFAGVLHGRIAEKGTGSPAVVRPRVTSVGLVEAAMVVGALDVLFAAFVALQVPHFFGGAATLNATPGLTAAEYAVRGFFELVVVEALAVPILLGAEAIMRGKPRRQLAAFRVLAAVNVGLLGAIAASAVLRLLLYRSAFGLTESRVYAGAVLVWLAAVLAVLTATALAGRPERFTFGAIVAAFAVLLTLNALDPDALIASTNLARATQETSTPAAGLPGRFDVAYNAGLSADALPTLIEGLRSLTAEDRAALERALAQRRAAAAADGFRSWNLGRSRGNRAMDVAPLGGG